jgi:hypothetical protein
MWDRENRRAARRAYKQARRDARYQYRASRQNWRGYGYRRSIAPFIVLVIVFGSFFFSRMHGFGMMGLFSTVVPLIVIVALVVIFALRGFMGRGSGYQQPYDPSAQQPQQGSEQTYYQAPPTPPQADQPSEAYSEYNQGYQSGSEQGNENEPLYRPKEPYSQDEQPQAYYPQQMPPMEQS